MLNGLDQVDWAELDHAFGPAAGLPDQLRGLVSRDEEHRRRSLRALSEHIYHQNTIYEATPGAIPFVLEVLTAPECHEQPQVLSLLTSIATEFDGKWWLPEGLPIARYRAQAASGDDLDEHGHESYARTCLRAYDAVRAGVPVFRELLTREPPVARMAAYALAWFPEDAPESLKALANITGGDDEGVVAATASVAMGLLRGRPTITLDDPRPIARWGAAVALATVDGEEATQDVVDELITTVRALPDNDEVPFLRGNLAGYAGGALRLTGRRHADRTFDALLRRILDVPGGSTFYAVKEALRLAFPAGALPRGTAYPALDDRQRRLVDALACSPGAWLTYSVSFGRLVAEYGLPAGNAAMRDYTSTR
ncbi:hypothetical protein [Lentzea californiensis]|uniref:hypothetical protein n=1 Tax=Lentzea californiensis TaxID=438851 RepID=UPI002165876A|nr:hypothetical protein [Lentzea californiensis]MCR3752960.1 hypothetical protein [Lentzea californiensis]